MCMLQEKKNILTVKSTHCDIILYFSLTYLSLDHSPEKISVCKWPLDKISENC